MTDTESEESSEQESSRLRLIIAGGRTVLFGRNSRLSARIWAVALVGTVAVAAIVAVTTVRYTPTGPTAGGTVALHSPSYTQLIDWFIATYTDGRNYPLFIIGPVALLLGAVGSTYLNSGLFPTGGLVLGPIFGFFVNRVGNPIVPKLNPAPVSFSDAIIFALTGAFLYGIPITIIGFIIGTVLRHVVISGRQI